MTKANVLDRVSVVKNDVQPAAKVVDLTQPAPPRLTYALYQANRAANKIDPMHVVYNDWHKQGLTIGEVNELIAKYNKITGYVYTPKVKEAKPAKEVKTTKKEAVIKPIKGASKPAQNPALAAKIQALKDLRKEGLLSVDELVKALAAIEA